MGGYLPVRRVAGLSADSDAVNNSTTLVDSDLTIAVEKDRVYRFTARLLSTSTDAANLKVSLDVPDGSSGFQFAGDAADGATPDSVGTDIAAAFTAAATEGLVVVHGTLTAGADGDITVQFAQNAAAAVDTTLLAGSYLELEEY